MNQPETRFKDHVLKRLKTYPDIWVVKVQQVAIRGTPDLLMCVRGHFVAWELKVDGKDATPLQSHVLEAIRKANGLARVVTPATLVDAIKELECLAYAKSPQQSLQQILSLQLPKPPQSKRTTVKATT